MLGLLRKKKAKAVQDVSGDAGVGGNSPPRELTVAELYGEDKPYPEPLSAGRVPHAILRERHLKRAKQERFLYSVRFRTGPLGIVFDNKVICYT